MRVAAVLDRDDENGAEVVRRFMEHFYEWPAYDLVGDALVVCLRDVERLAPAERARLVAWFVRVGRVRPHSVVRSCDAVRRNPATTPEQRRVVLEVLHGATATPAGTGAPVVASRAELDAAWADFSVTGDYAAVCRVVDVLERDDRVAPRSLPYRFDGRARRQVDLEAAALGTLTEMAAGHRRVLDICRAEMKRRSLGVRIQLRDVIRAASVSRSHATSARTAEATEVEPPAALVAFALPAALVWEAGRSIVIEAVPAAFRYLGRVARAALRLARAAGRALVRLARWAYEVLPVLPSVVRAVRTVVIEVVDLAALVKRLAIACVRRVREMLRALWPWIRRGLEATLAAVRRTVARALTWIRPVLRAAFRALRRAWTILCRLARALAPALRMIARAARRAVQLARVILRGVWRPIRAALRLVRAVARRAVDVARRLFRAVWRPIRAAFRIASRMATRVLRILAFAGVRAVRCARLVLRPVVRAFTTALRLMITVGRRSARWVRSLLRRAVVATRRALAAARRVIRRLMRPAFEAFRSALAMLAAVRADAVAKVRALRSAIALRIADAVHLGARRHR